MRKLFPLLLMLLTMLLCTTALADTISLPDFAATCEIDGKKYTIITRSNLAAHEDLLGASAEEALKSWTAEGIYVQAWNADQDVCIQISAQQDEYSAAYHDINEVSQDDRKEYRIGHSSDSSGTWRAQGYDYSSADWQNYKNIGRFLKLQYTRSVNGESYRGYARKTVRNGWHIHIEYQVYGRSAKNSDNNALEALMKNWTFTQILPRSAVAPGVTATNVVFSQVPPAESNTGKFTVEGRGTPGMSVTCVVMRLTDDSALVHNATIDNKGKFALDISLPREGFWLITYIIENGEETVEEGVFDGTTYAKNLLTVTMDSKLPATLELTGSTLVISGTTMRQTKVQCVVDGRYQKNITTNNSGRFSFTIDTSDEGLYNIALVFQKKGYDDRRMACSASRTYTAEDLRQKIREDAIKPAYKKLCSDLMDYKGRYMVYTLNVQSVEETSTGYLILAGMSVSKGVYKDLVFVRSTEDPGLKAGDKVKMYLTCIGSREWVSDEGSKAYPYFDLQFID